jgi:hypothetical protein
MERQTRPGRRADISALASLFVVIVQMGGGIWYMSKMDAAVQQLSAAVTEMKSDRRLDNTTLQDHAGRIRILEHERDQDDKQTEQLLAELRRKGVL